jgi:hypothetical protein
MKIGLVLGLLLALSVAGCAKKDSGDGVASANGAKNAGTGASPTASIDPEERMLKWQQCLKDNGIDMQVGSADGKNTIRISPGPNSDPEKDKAAMEKCKQYAPNGGDMGKADPQMEEAMRKFAKCMRENGVPNFPDPSANGGIMFNKDSGVDPESDSFKAAQQKCESLMPRPSMRASR